MTVQTAFRREAFNIFFRESVSCHAEFLRVKNHPVFAK